MDLHFPKASYGVFHIQVQCTRQFFEIFKLRGFDFINYIYIETQTNLAG